MRNVSEFNAWHEQWLQRPRPLSCYHENTQMRIREDRSMVGCLACGFVVSADVEDMSPVILP